MCGYIYFTMAEPGIIIEEYGEENWAFYQPEAELIFLKECIQIRFTKKAADAVNIYKRQSDMESWEFIATAVQSPFDDHDAEINWQYCIRGVKENKEIGIPALLAASENYHHSK